MTDWNGDGNYDISDSYIDYQLECGDDSDSSGGSGRGSGSGRGRGPGGGNNKSKGGCLTLILIYVVSMILIALLGGADSISDYLLMIFFPIILFGFIVIVFHK